MLRTLLVLILLALPLAAQGNPSRPLRSAQSSVRLVPREPGSKFRVPRTDNVRFTMAGDGPWRLYEERFISQDDGGNCCLTQLSVTAYDINLAGRQQKRWSVRTTGDTGELFGPFYQVFREGCCGASDSYRYYLTDSGKLTYESIQFLLQVETYFAHGLDRYIAILNDRSSGQQIAEGSASLSYGSESGAMQRLLVRFPNHSLVGAVLRGRDGKEARKISLNGDRQPETRALLSGFSIELRFIGHEHGDETAILLPVEDDVVRFERAKPSEGLSIESSAR